MSNRGLIQKWAELLAPKTVDRFKEQELLPDFLTDVFTSVLGYVRPTDNPARYTISRERYVEVDGKFADAAIGEFGAVQSRFVIALEGKGPTDPLDRPFKSRKMSAVDQGYRYAINLPCDWIIVTSMRQIRLYCKGNDQHTFERFLISDLAENDVAFKRFVFLLGADRIVPQHGGCHLDQLRAASDKAGRELTKDFYLRYANMREDAFEQLCAENSDHSRHALLSATQKLLDRVLFCAFCEDRGLLPDDTLNKAFEHHDPYNPRPVCTLRPSSTSMTGVTNCGWSKQKPVVIGESPSARQECIGVPLQTCYTSSESQKVIQLRTTIRKGSSISDEGVWPICRQPCTARNVVRHGD